MYVCNVLLKVIENSEDKVRIRVVSSSFFRLFFLTILRAERPGGGNWRGSEDEGADGDPCGKPNPQEGMIYRGEGGGELISSRQ